MPAPENIYYTPDGYVDLPFDYVYDASSLTDGTTPPAGLVPVQWDSDFVLRAILGVPSAVNVAAGGTFQLYNYSGGFAMSSGIKKMSNTFGVVPEKIYPKNNALRFQLANVLRANTACGLGAIYRSQIIFRGVKRYQPGAPGYAPGSPALPPNMNPNAYTFRPWTYSLALNLNWFYWIAANSPNPVRTFVVEVQDYDFELHKIDVADAVTGSRLITDLFSLQLYDATAKRALSSMPVIQSAINNTRDGYGNPVFPVPPIVYPVWTQIRVDIGSLVCNTDASAPYLLQINFVGVQRIPKSPTSPSGPGGTP